MPSEADEQRSLLREGISAGDAAEYRRRLDLPDDADDAAIARRLVRRLSNALEPPRPLVEDPRPIVAPRLIAGADASFLGRLHTTTNESATEDGPTVEGLEDVRTILAVLRAGSLRQRRAAVERLSKMLTSDRKRVPSDQLKRIADVLPRIRDVEIAYELSEARAHLPGTEGKEYKADREAFVRMTTQLQESVQRFWDGEDTAEPVLRLPSDQRALLQIRVRDLPDDLVDHLGAILETSSDWMMRPEDRQGLLESLCYCGDPRLVPSLLAVLEGDDAEAAVDAARALGRIDDPRVHPRLVGAYERSVIDRNKAVFAGALADAGDARGRDYVRGLVSSSDDPRVIRRALEALQALGGPEDVGAVRPQLEEGDFRLRVQAVRTLGAIGDARALDSLRELRDMTSVSAIWAEVEDAEAAIRARIELRGETADEGAALSSVEKAKLARTSTDPMFVRLMSFKDYLFGVLWLFVGGARRAIGRFERAAARRSDWARPLLLIALSQARQGNNAQALTAFRRAIEANRTEVEQNPAAMRALATVFLRRADEVEGEGRRDIARGLLEEVTGLDLRRAPSALRFEVTRRYEAARKGIH